MVKRLVVISLAFACFIAATARAPAPVATVFHRSLRNDHLLKVYSDASISRVVIVGDYAWVAWETRQYDGTALMHRTNGIWTFDRHRFIVGYDPSEAQLARYEVPTVIAKTLSQMMPALHNAVPRVGDTCDGSNMWLGTSNVGEPYNTAQTSVVNMIAYVPDATPARPPAAAWAYKTFDGRWWYQSRGGRFVATSETAKHGQLIAWRCFSKDLPGEALKP